MTRIPTMPAIVDALHAAAEVNGCYDPEIVGIAACALTRAGADEDERGAILTEVQRVYAERFKVWGAC